MQTPAQMPPTSFMARRWIFRAQAIVFGLLAVFGLVMGPGFLLHLIESADGRKDIATPGLIMTGFGVASALAWLMALANLRHRRRPVLRIRREGVEVVYIGRSSLDRMPMVPSLVRAAWLLGSGQGFRATTYRARWPSIRGVEVHGLPMVRVLAIDGRFHRLVEFGLAQDREFVEGYSFQQVDLKVSLERAAESIEVWRLAPEAVREALPGWDDEPDR